MADDWAQRAVELSAWTGSFLRDTATGRSRYRTNTSFVALQSRGYLGPWPYPQPEVFRRSGRDDESFDGALVVFNRLKQRTSKCVDH